MANIIDRLPQKDGTGTTKANYTEIGLGNDKGAIYFGHIHEKGDVTSDIALLTHDGKHFICLDGDGQRKGWTTIACPGNFSVEAGDNNKKIDSTIMINSKNGDVQIIATDGNIRLEANNIEMIARGEGGSAGNITCTATESFVIKDTKKILMDCSSFFNLSSTGTGDVIAKSCLNIYGSIIKGVTDAVAIKEAKNSNRKFWEKVNPKAANRQARRRSRGTGR